MLRLLRKAVAEGEYTSISEHLRDAVRAWHGQQQEDTERLAACAPGLAVHCRPILFTRRGGGRCPVRGFVRRVRRRRYPAFELRYRPAALADLEDIFPGVLRVSPSSIVVHRYVERIHARCRLIPRPAVYWSSMRRSRARTAHQKPHGAACTDHPSRA